jgi:uncharacterized protein (TIGR00730 family)
MTRDKQAKPAGHGHQISTREAWKLFGIMAEFFEATERLTNIEPAVSVFGSARVKPGTLYWRLAEETARLLSDAGFTVISGGGPGLMEATNKGAFEGKGTVVGLNIDLPREQPSSKYQHISLRFKHFFARKVAFARYASAFVVLPGGYGTLDELFEALVLVQTQRVTSFPVVLLGHAYWDGLVDWMRSTVAEHEMVGPNDLALIHVTDDIDEAVRLIKDSDDSHLLQW